MTSVSLDFFTKSILLAVALTALPAFLLIIIWELKLIKISIMIGWVLFTLTWNAVVLLKLVDRIVGTKPKK